MAKIDAFFKLMNEQGASDLHLVAGQVPILRVHGDLERIKYQVLESDELKKMLYEIAPELAKTGSSLPWPGVIDPLQRRARGAPDRLLAPGPVVASRIRYQDQGPAALSKGFY